MGKSLVVKARKDPGPKYTDRDAPVRCVAEKGIDGPNVAANVPGSDTPNVDGISN